MKLNKDHYLSMFYIVFGVLLMIQTSRIRSLFAVGSNDLGPKFFPYLCGIGIILCGIGKFLSSAKSSSKAFLKNKRDYIRLFLMWAILVTYVLAVKYVGYIVSSLVLMFVMPLLLADKKRVKPWQSLIFSVIIVAAIYTLFSYVIKIPLPQGVWTKALIKALR